MTVSDWVKQFRGSQGLSAERSTVGNNSWRMTDNTGIILKESRKDSPDEGKLVTDMYIKPDSFITFEFFNSGEGNRYYVQYEDAINTFELSDSVGDTSSPGKASGTLPTSQWFQAEFRFFQENGSLRTILTKSGEGVVNFTDKNFDQVRNGGVGFACISGELYLDNTRVFYDK